MTNTDLEARIRRLEDIEAIKRLQNVYARTCDLGADPDALIALFVPQDDEGVVWKSNIFGEHHGLEAIHKHFSGVTSTMPWAAHFMDNPVVDVSDDGLSATGRWDLLEFSTMAKADGSEGLESVFMTAWYTNDFRKIDGQWYFYSIDVQMQHISDWRQGWVRQPNRTGAPEDVAAGRAQR
ncbi:hypothetical protein FB384_003422 [Prauserella sediminis]|uniref:SnoaL-like domain-containing protein n=1 Tax=Prauserella sediminis TaxID=577680 RepID=A0A839XU06_9PSEU|nr:nuclear transport factor 2 family protein [Prauserella sediminis]MBB3664518.1 hypothetical protein [Prauserella sediminis]